MPRKKFLVTVVDNKTITYWIPAETAEDAQMIVEGADYDLEEVHPYCLDSAEWYIDHVEPDGDAG